jgi:DNA-binding response OmpR family regulator
MGTRVLLVEDEESVVALIRVYLEREGFELTVTGDGVAALELARSEDPAVIVLDVGLPGAIDGLEVCRRLRAQDDWTPVLFVTARDEEVDRVLGLELGADDYVTKPFSPRELVARVKAILRREALPAQGSHPLQVGGIRLDPSGRHVWACGQPVELTATEFDLLAYLMRHTGQVLGRDQLLAAVWGYPDAGSRTVDVHIAQLRGKLGPASPIRTVRGVGYAVDRR